MKKMMRKIQIIVFLLLAVCLWCCSSEVKEKKNDANDVVVIGNVFNRDGKTLNMHLMLVDTTGTNNEEYEPVSSSVVTKGGFNLKYTPNDAEPQFYRIGFNKTNSIITVARKGEQLTFAFSNPDTLVRDYKVSGGKDAQLMQELDQRLARFIDSTDYLLSLFKYCDDSSRTYLKDIFSQIRERHHNFLTTFIADHPQSLTTISAFYQKYMSADLFVSFFDEEADIELLEQIYKNLSQAYPHNCNVRWLAKRIELIHKNIDNQQDNPL